MVAGACWRSTSVACAQRGAPVWRAQPQQSTRTSQSISARASTAAQQAQLREASGAAERLLSSVTARRSPPHPSREPPRVGRQLPPALLRIQACWSPRPGPPEWHQRCARAGEGRPAGQTAGGGSCCTWPARGGKRERAQGADEVVAAPAHEMSASTHAHARARCSVRPAPSLTMRWIQRAPPHLQVDPCGCGALEPRVQRLADTRAAGSHACSDTAAAVQAAAASRVGR